MSRIDAALATNPFRVDDTQCLLLSSRLTGFRPAEARYPWSDLDPASRICFKLLFVSICHQINWDFLQNNLFLLLRGKDAEEMIEYASQIRPATISILLENYSRPERIRANERAKILRETADAIITRYDGQVTKLTKECRTAGKDGLFEKLKFIPAFAEDPLAKKSNAFAQELAREGIVQFEDANLIPPAIDYHIIRLYLRTGRVYSANDAVFASLNSGITHRPRLLKLLRETTAAALAKTAEMAKLPVHELNYLEWQLGRTRCERDFINCDGEWPAELTDDSIIALSKKCPLRTDCHAYNMPQWRSLIEPALHLSRSFY